MNTTRTTLAYFWTKAKRYPFLLGFFFLFTALAVFGQEVLATIILADIFDLFAEFSANPNEGFEAIKDKIWIFLGIQITMSFFCWRISDLINESFQPKVMRDIENDCFGKLQNHSYSFFANSFSGGLVSKVSRLASSFEKVADVTQYNLFTLVIRIIGALGFIFWHLPTLGWGFVSWILVYLIMTIISNRWSRKFWTRASSLDTKVTASLADSLSNIFNVKIFARKKYEKKRFGEVTEKRRIARRNAWMSGTLIRSWQGILMVGFETFVLFFLLNNWNEGTITAGTIFGVQMFIWIVFSQLWELGRIFQDFTNALADSEEMIQILHQEPNLLDVSKPQKCKIKEGSISFEKISFEYGNKENKIFDQFNLQIPAGQKIGLVGESGAGKSTMVNLLLRFMDTTSGMVKIDGQNIAKITQDDLRRNIAYVPQESILFHRTLAENIAYGNPEATDIQIQEAAIKAHAHDFVQNFEEGYQTLVGERGIKLSGGQKQRVSIARAMLKKAPILILDEATSALDSESEKKVQDALLKLIEGKTVLAIAHRLSTLKHMDRIIVMDNGRIIEDGSHGELLKAKGKYAELWNHQSEGFV